MNETEREKFAEAFYSRQTVLKELGKSGQKKLSEARVAVVGVGGLGTVSSLYLTLAGIGYVRVIDQDTLEPHNLHRQILYTPNKLSYPKAEAAAQQLQEHNPTVTVEAASENLNASNAEKLLKDVDIVVDGLDNMQTRHIVNRACVKLKVPYVFGAAIGLEGNASVFYPPKTGCLECLMPSNAAADSQTCDTRGIIGATAGVVSIWFFFNPWVQTHCPKPHQINRRNGRATFREVAGVRLHRHGLHGSAHSREPSVPRLPRQTSPIRDR